jgi:protein-disulfide isomerase
MKVKVDSAITTTLIVCVLVTTGIVVRREFFSTSGAIAPLEQKPVLIAHWRDDLVKGISLGPDVAPVQLIEFADFECPFCGSLHKTLKVVREHHPMQIGLTYVHFPIPGHRFALPAARVAECAGEQGRFEAIFDQLFEGQDQFGLKPWDDYATAAGVPDLVAFDACVKNIDPITRVEEGKALGAQLDVHGTPTIIINGWKLGHPPTEEELDGMVKAILAGRSPVRSDGKSTQ